MNEQAPTIEDPELALYVENVVIPATREGSPSDRMFALIELNMIYADARAANGK